MATGNEILLAEQVGLALRKAKPTDKVTPRRYGEWNLTLRNGRAFKASARLDEQWLLLDSRLGTNRAARSKLQNGLWGLLSKNVGLHGGAKFVIDAGGQPRARAEIPLCQAVERERVEEACAGLQEAVGLFRKGKNGLPKNRASAQAIEEDENRACDLEQLLQDIGWAFIKRSGGRLAVNLDLPGGPVRRAILGHRSGIVTAEVDLNLRGTLPEICRQALGLLLLTANGAARMARAAAEETNEGPSARLEVVLWPGASATEISHALAALSVFAGICASEADAIQNRTVAEDYLAVRGWAPQPRATETHSKAKEK